MDDKIISKVKELEVIFKLPLKIQIEVFGECPKYGFIRCGSYYTADQDICNNNCPHN